MSKGLQEVKEVIGKRRFVKLYGETDFAMLRHNGSVSDVIGQGKWYRAKIIAQ
jgi:hypothetical protein